MFRQHFVKKSLYERQANVVLLAERDYKLLSWHLEPEQSRENNLNPTGKASYGAQFPVNLLVSYSIDPTKAWEQVFSLAKWSINSNSLSSWFGFFGGVVVCRNY